jgi:hypothetical protein
MQQFKKLSIAVNWDLCHNVEVAIAFIYCMSKGNPNPVQTKAFISKQFQAYGEIDSIPLSKKVTGIRLPQDVHEALYGLPAEDRVSYLRRVISEAVRRDLIS